MPRGRPKGRKSLTFTKEAFMPGLRIEHTRYLRWKKAHFKEQMVNPDLNWSDFVRAALDLYADECLERED